MDKSEAQKILRQQLARFSNHTELVPLVESERDDILRFAARAARLIRLRFSSFGMTSLDALFELSVRLMTVVFELLFR